MEMVPETKAWKIQTTNQQLKKRDKFSRSFEILMGTYEGKIDYKLERTIILLFCFSST